MAPDRARVVFEVTCPTIGFEEVRVVGSLAELGAWDPTLAVPLQTNDRQYPVWRSAEVLLPKEAPEPLQYKYVMVFSGAVVQWEAGPNRSLQSSSLLDGATNLIEDVMFDLDGSLARKNSGVRIRFQEALEKSQLPSLEMSRFASSVPSPLRAYGAGQTPVEKSPRGGTRELESVLRELMMLEPMYRVGQKEVRRAAAAVRAAIEAERSSGRCRRRARGCTCAAVSLLMVPLVPMVVAAGILWRVPSARSTSFRRIWPWSMPWGQEAEAPLVAGPEWAAWGALRIIGLGRQSDDHGMERGAARPRRCAWAGSRSV